LNPKCTTNEDGSITYPLDHPVVIQRRAAGSATVTEETVSEVTVRRAKAKDLRVMDRHKGKMGQSLALISALTGLNEKQVDELDAADVTGLSEIVSDFFPDLQETGETS